MIGRLVCVLLAAVPLSGCFKEPVAEATALPLDKALLGAWFCTPIAGQVPSAATLTVLRFDDHDYFAELRDNIDKDETPARYRAYLVKTRGLTFLSAEDLDPLYSDWRWTAIRYSFGDDGALSLQVPARRILDLPAGSALRAFRVELSRPDA